MSGLPASADLDFLTEAVSAGTLKRSDVPLHGNDGGDLDVGESERALGLSVVASVLYLGGASGNVLFNLAFALVLKLTSGTKTGLDDLIAFDYGVKAIYDVVLVGALWPTVKSM